jgi:hypothetical protein
MPEPPPVTTASFPVNDPGAAFPAAPAGESLDAIWLTSAWPRWSRRKNGQEAEHHHIRRRHAGRLPG